MDRCEVRRRGDDEGHMGRGGRQREHREGERASEHTKHRQDSASCPN